MLQRIQEYIANGKTIINDWHQYTINTSIPLDDRWECFLAAPSDWKREETNTDIPLQALSDVLDSPYDDFCLEYGSSLTIDELFDQIQEKLDDGEVEDLTQEMIDEAKEEAMAMKLGRWEYND